MDLKAAEKECLQEFYLNLLFFAVLLATVGGGAWVIVASAVQTDESWVLAVGAVAAALTLWAACASLKSYFRLQAYRKATERKRTPRRRANPARTGKSGPGWAVRMSDGFEKGDSSPEAVKARMAARFKREEEEKKASERAADQFRRFKDNRNLRR